MKVEKLVEINDRMSETEREMIEAKRHKEDAERKAAEAARKVEEAEAKLSAVVDEWIVIENEMLASVPRATDAELLDAVGLASGDLAEAIEAELKRRGIEAS